MYNGAFTTSAQLASVLEIFYDPLFKKLTMFSDLHWSKESRIQVSVTRGQCCDYQKKLICIIDSN
jgi:hypothetical protein